MGHRDAPEELYGPLLKELERHVAEYGVDEFLVGSRGRFDQIAARALREIKELHPEVKLTLLLAYPPSERRADIPAWFDESLYPAGMGRVPKRLAIVRANRCAVDASGYMIAYAWQAGSNTVKLAAYAQGRKGMTVTVLGAPGAGAAALP